MEFVAFQTDSFSEEDPLLREIKEEVKTRLVMFISDSGNVCQCSAVSCLQNFMKGRRKRCYFRPEVSLCTSSCCGT